MAKYEFTGKKYLFDFGDKARYQLYFVDDTNLEVTVVEDSYYAKGTVNHFDIQVTPLREKLYMLTWIEDKTGNTVTHVEDYENMTVCTNITDLTTKSFWRLKGKISPL